MMGDTVAIIPCTSQKSNVAGPAREVWVGNHFQLVLAHAEMFYDKVLVLSFKYGLISPDFVIEPYDINIKYASAGDRLKWWQLVRQQIIELSEENPALIALYTGNTERERIMREFVKHGVRNVIVPWSDASTGGRMQRVYDGDPPFDLEKLKNGEYELPENFGEPKKRGRKPKVAPEPTLSQGPIEWEGEEAY